MQRASWTTVGRLGRGWWGATMLGAMVLAGVAARAQQLSIAGYQLVDSKRVSLTQYDYSYQARVQDAGPAGYASATGTVTSANPATVVTQGQVMFPAIAGNGQATSTGTFTIRQDRRYPFDASQLQWSLQGTPVLPAGTVSATNNPQVASYTVNLPMAGAVTVQFGPTTSYGRQTWTQTTTAAGPVTVLVAGMLGSSTYHMQATVQFANGTTVTDADHTFTTGAAPTLPQLTVETPNGLTPQPGVEQITWSGVLGVTVADLQGRGLWTYSPTDAGGANIEGAKLLPNGHFLFTLGQYSSTALREPNPPDYVVIAIREVDLTGAIVRQMTVAQLNAKMQAAGYTVTLQQFHHDVTPLPNGHTLILANTLRTFTNLVGYPGQTQVLGDVVVDVDANYNPVWVWNEFDHLDVNRHPLYFPDWTHSNAIVYSKDDGNFLISVRHQNWILKVDYRNGAGSGGVLWHLGYQGDFTLTNGVDPTDWQYAQHLPSFFSKNTSGVFSLGVMDNGDDRMFPTGVTCGTAGQPVCLYTTIPVYQIDENAKTATLLFHQILPPNLYSFYGGNTDQLLNGDVEYMLSGTSSTDSDLFEVTQTSSPVTVWHVHMTNGQAYRGYRLPSLYPGVQWQ